MGDTRDIQLALGDNAACQQQKNLFSSLLSPLSPVHSLFWCKSPIPTPALPLNGREKQEHEQCGAVTERFFRIRLIQTLLPLQGEGRDGDG